MRRIIRLGDPTSHGGKVVSATSHVLVGGIPVARLGDQCTCPIKGHSNCVITEGDPNWLIDGIPVALEGCAISCGGVVLSTAPNAGRVYDGGAAGAAGGTLKATPISQALSATYQNSPPQFDEQILFADEQGRAYANVKYVLHLADGGTLEGRTDKQGKTERIVTDEPTVIQRADLFSNATLCCPRHAEASDSAQPGLTVELLDVETNPQDIGASIAKVTAEDENRPLTSGEIAMCKLIFKDAINYSVVKVHRGEYLWFGLQDDNTAMTPNGEIYFNDKHFKEDFSLGTGLEANLNKQWFMHEMVHVWQYQLGYPVKLRGAIRLGLDYAYILESNKRLSDYNMEAQGDVLADYFVLKHLRDTRAMRRRQYENDLTLYEEVIHDFLANPKDVSNLP